MAATAITITDESAMSQYRPGRFARAKWSKWLVTLGLCAAVGGGFCGCGKPSGGGKTSSPPPPPPGPATKIDRRKLEQIREQSDLTQAMSLSSFTNNYFTPEQYHFYFQIRVGGLGIAASHSEQRSADLRNKTITLQVQIPDGANRFSAEERQYFDKRFQGLELICLSANCLDANLRLNFVTEAGLLLHGEFNIRSITSAAQWLDPFPRVDWDEISNDPWPTRDTFWHVFKVIQQVQFIDRVVYWQPNGEASLGVILRNDGKGIDYVLRGEISPVFTQAWGQGSFVADDIQLPQIGGPFEKTRLSEVLEALPAQHLESVSPGPMPGIKEVSIEGQVLTVHLDSPINKSIRAKMVGVP